MPAIMPPLRMGQKYDISFVLVNKNGYNDLQWFGVWFRPYGTPKPYWIEGRQIRPQDGWRYWPKVDICFNDISVLLNTEVTWLLLMMSRLSRLLTVAHHSSWFCCLHRNSDDMSVDMSKNGLVYNSNRSISTTTTTDKAVAGYPLKVSLRLSPVLWVTVDPSQRCREW